MQEAIFDAFPYITLATALVAARNNGNTSITDGVIQMLERWKTADSVRNYDRQITPASSPLVSHQTRPPQAATMVESPFFVSSLRPIF